MKFDSSQEKINSYKVNLSSSHFIWEKNNLVHSLITNENLFRYRTLKHALCELTCKVILRKLSLQDNPSVRSNVCQVTREVYYHLILGSDKLQSGETDGSIQLKFKLLFQIMTYIVQAKPAPTYG